MREWFIRYAAEFSGKYLLLQMLVIIALFAMGFVILSAMTSKNIGTSEENQSLKQWGNYDRFVTSIFIKAFPVGLSVFIIEAYIMLLLGVPYNTGSVLVVYLVTLAIFLRAGIRSGRIRAVVNTPNMAMLLIALLCVLVAVYMACSGNIPISISNDSMYYFHEYPRDIVYFGTLRDQFDTFLTDTGLGSVVIDTLPFLFGFNESFGIREAMHISFIAYFGLMVLPMFEKILPDEVDFMGQKMKLKAICVTLIVTLIMATSSPVVILGHWAMANMYFMELFFMAAFEMYVFSEKITSAVNMNPGKSQDKNYRSNLVPAALICVACSLIRMEGGIFMAFMLMVFTLLEVDDLLISMMITLPIMVLMGGYALKIHLSYTIDNPYTFLSPVKSLIQMALFVCIMVYSIFIKRRLPDLIRRNMPVLITVGILAANGLLLVYNRTLYIANLRAFYRNLLGQSGWGMLPNLTAASIFLLLVLEIADRMKGRQSSVNMQTVYFSVLTVGFVLVTVVVSFARGDELMQQVGDSGNRVLLQVAPLLIFTVVLYFIRAYERNRENK